MDVRLLRALFLLILISCTQVRLQRPVTSDHAHELPSWVYAAMESCYPQELCFSGEGTSNNEAEQRAFAGLIENLTSSMTMDSEPVYLKKIDFKIRTYVSDRIKFHVNELAKMSYLKEASQKDQMHYSLVALKSQEMQRYILRNLNEIQNQVDLLIKVRSGDSRILYLALEREYLQLSLKKVFSIENSFNPLLKSLLERKDWY